MARSVLLVVVLAVAGSCNGKADGGPAATIPPAPTTTSAPTDPYAVPAVIDEPYANRVLAALDQVEGEVVRSLVANRVPQIDDTKRLRSIYNDPQLPLEVDGLVKTAGTSLSQYKTPPGNRKTTVTRIVIAKRDCIFLEARTDFSEVVLVPPERPTDQVKAITLRPTQDGADPENLNPTPWSVSNAELIKQASSPQEPQCSA